MGVGASWTKKKNSRKLKYYSTKKKKIEHANSVLKILNYADN